MTTATPRSTASAATTTVHMFGRSPVTKNSRMPSTTRTSAPSTRTSSADTTVPSPLRSSANCRQASAAPASTTMAGMTASSGMSGPVRVAISALPAASRAMPSSISVTGRDGRRDVGSAAVECRPGRVSARFERVRPHPGVGVVTHSQA